ncbi:unnamed protein product [Effrenium voratum]|nr:unnamed protein product [Effrenium voratum]
MRVERSLFESGSSCRFFEPWLRGFPAARSAQKAMPGRAYECFGGEPAPDAEPEDGFAAFFGYAEVEAEVKPQKPQDAFQEWYGYEESVQEAQIMHLPDRDPCSVNDESCQRLAVEATEASLALLKEIIEEKRTEMLLQQGDDKLRLQQEIYLLKLQQSRLAHGIWSLHMEPGTELD